jgi:hypothetical protein
LDYRTERGCAVHGFYCCLVVREARHSCRHQVDATGRDDRILVGRSKANQTRQRFASVCLYEDLFLTSGHRGEYLRWLAYNFIPCTGASGSASRIRS